VRSVYVASSWPWWLRSDIHEEASVKTGARRSRDDPDIPSASPAVAERPEILRLLPFTLAASPCALSDLGMQPESCSRSRRGRSSPHCACVSWPGVPEETRLHCLKAGVHGPDTAVGLVADTVFLGRDRDVS
jgi:hypothetical protein